MSGPRTIAGLAVAAVITTAATALVYADQSGPPPPPDTPLFPELARQLDDVTAISVDGPTGTVTLSADPAGWTLSVFDGYPADPAVVGAVLGGLADLRLAEAKTATPALHHLLGVAAPDSDGARGHRVVLTFGMDQGAAALIVGDQGRLATAPSRYVRLPSEDQAWLAMGALEIPDAAIDWVDPRILDIPAGDIVHLEIHPAARAPLVIQRDPVSASLAIADLPDDRVVEETYRVTNMATVLEDLAFTDVRSAVELDWPEDGAVGIFRTAGGVILTARLARDAGDGLVWVRFETAVDPAAPDASGTPAATAAEITSRLGPWAFRLPRHKTDRLQMTVEDITVPRARTDADAPAP